MTLSDFLLVFVLGVFLLYMLYMQTLDKEELNKNLVRGLKFLTFFVGLYVSYWAAASLDSPALFGLMLSLTLLIPLGRWVTDQLCGYCEHPTARLLQWWCFFIATLLLLERWVNPIRYPSLVRSSFLVFLITGVIFWRVSHREELAPILGKKTRKFNLFFRREKKPKESES